MVNNRQPEYDLKQSFLRGEFSREEFWTQINATLNEVRKLQHLLHDDAASLEITEKNLVINYEILKKHRIKLEIPKNDLRTASFTVLANGNYESLLENTIFELSSKSKKFLDIGANMGFYALGAALVNRELEVLAFEPNPGIRRSLIENTILNQIENRIKILEYALSDFTGEATFTVPSFTGSGGGSLKNLHPEEGSPNQFQVIVERLDNLRAETIGTDLVKIDVEGAEFHLLKGGVETINEEHPTIIVELLRKWMKPFESKPQDVVDLLVKMNYVCFAVGDISMRQIATIDESTKETNFIFCYTGNTRHMKALSNGFE
jgi:FkbM family methyltransferase